MSRKVERSQCHVRAVGGEVAFHPVARPRAVNVRGQHERRPVEVGRLYEGFFEQRVFLGHQQLDLLDIQEEAAGSSGYRPVIIVKVVLVARHNDVVLPACERFNACVCPGARVDYDALIGIPLLYRAARFVEDGFEPGKVGRGDPYDEQVVGEFAVFLAHGLPLLDGFLCRVREAPACGREAGMSPFGRDDKLAFDLCLKRAYVVDECRSGGEEALGGRRPVELLGKCQELLEVACVHRCLRFRLPAVLPNCSRRRLRFNIKKILQLRVCFRHRAGTSSFMQVKVYAPFRPFARKMRPLQGHRATLRPCNAAVRNGAWCRSRRERGAK